MLLALATLAISFMLLIYDLEIFPDLIYSSILIYLVLALIFSKNTRVDILRYFKHFLNKD